MLTPNEREKLRQRLSERLGIMLKREPISGLKVNSAYHWQPPLHIRVGESCRHLEPKDDNPQEVLAIFEATVFLVCTPNHGDPDGLPYYFAREDVRRVERS